MSAHWHYKKTEPFIQQGRDHARNNFSREERSSLAILIRETLQNALDARADKNEKAVKVVIRSLSSTAFSHDYMKELISADYKKHLCASEAAPLPSIQDCAVLTIEDFGTNGLLGDFQDFNADGPGENWNAFWHREGEGAKSRASNGGAGQGKITYFKHSAAGVVLGLTVRSTDGQRLLMGKGSFLRDYQFEGEKYYRAAYWTTSSIRPWPESGTAEVDRFASAFGLSRAHSPGLSLVIPYAEAFDSLEALQSVILDFYLPIAAGRLEVQIGDTTVNSKTIDEIAEKQIPDSAVIEKGASFGGAYRVFARNILSATPTPVRLAGHWNKATNIPDDAFPEGVLEGVREHLQSGEIAAFKMPISFRKKDGKRFDTEFDVFIQLPVDLDRNEEAFVRQDLLIGGESHLGSFVQKARSLTWIRDQDLSDLLLAAEEPTHLKWNGSLARDKGLYANPENVLRSIRQAVQRLLLTLLKGSHQRDFRSLARYFSKPSTEELSSRSQSPGQSKKEQQQEKEKEPPEKKLKPIRIEGVGTSIRILPRTSVSMKGAQLPLSATLELAYEGLGLNAFADYDPFDFDLADSTYPFRALGVSVKARSRNRVDFDITATDFLLEISGFSPHMRMRARLNSLDGTEEVLEEGEDK